jgi:hypothetical protein
MKFRVLLIKKIILKSKCTIASQNMNRTTVHIYISSHEKYSHFLDNVYDFFIIRTKKVRFLSAPLINRGKDLFVSVNFQVLGATATLTPAATFLHEIRSSLEGL